MSRRPNPESRIPISLTAIRLACYFGTSPQFWINLQGCYDLGVAEDHNADRIRKEVHPRGKDLPGKVPFDAMVWFKLEKR